MSNKGDSDKSSKVEDAMINGIRTLWEEGHFFDYTIEVESRKFHVHKIALIAASGYFQEQFTRNSAESQENCIKLQNVTATAIEQLIKFMYTNEMEITEQTIMQILAAAIYLKITTAIEVCDLSIYRNLDVDNWVEMISVCRQLKHRKGIEEVEIYIDIKMLNILKVMDIYQLSYEDFYIFVKYWYTSDYDLFILINKWVNSNLKQRRKYQRLLLQQVRYSLMSLAELESIIEMKMYKGSDGSWGYLVNEALRYHKLPTNKKVLQKSSQSELRTFCTVVVFSRGDTQKVGCCYEQIDGGCFVERPDLKMPEGTGEVHAETVINNYLIVCVGMSSGLENDTESPLQQWYIFNPRIMQWSKMANLPRFFRQGTLVTDEKYIYAVGGAHPSNENGINGSNINRYSFLSDKWIPFAQLLFVEKDHSACVLDGKLYVSGGVLNDGPSLDTLDCMTLSTRKWRTKSPMLEARRGHAMYVMTIRGEDVLGVFDDHFKVEFYSLVKDQWTFCTFNFDASHPLKCHVGVVLYGENVVYLVDTDMEEAWDQEGWEFIVLDFDTKSTKVIVSFLENYRQRRTDPAQTHTTVLAIPLCATYTKHQSCYK